MTCIFILNTLEENFQDKCKKELYIKRPKFKYPFSKHHDFLIISISY